MSNRREIPPHWLELMERRGISSVNQLCNISRLGPPTVLDIIHGKADGSPRRPTDETILKLAGALGVERKVIHKLVGWPVEIAETWDPPAESARLTPKQRKILEDLIRIMVEDSNLPPDEERSPKLRSV